MVKLLHHVSDILCETLREMWDFLFPSVVAELSSPSLHVIANSFFLVLQGTLRVSKYCNEAVVMTDGSSSKDSGDDTQQTDNGHVNLSKKFFRLLCKFSVFQQVVCDPKGGSQSCFDWVYRKYVGHLFSQVIHFN